MIKSPNNYVVLRSMSAPNTACTRSPAKIAGAGVVGVGAFSGSLRGSKLVPAE